MSIKIFRMNENTIVVSPLNKEETNDWYCSLEDFENPIEDVVEVNYNDGYWEEIYEDEAGEYKKVQVKDKIWYGYQTFKSATEKFYGIDEPDYIFYSEI